MALLSYFLIITISVAGNTVDDGTSTAADFIGMDVVPEIEVLAPRYTGESDSHNTVQGVTVFGERGNYTEQGYRDYRRSFATVSSLISEYAVFMIAGIVAVTFGAVALGKIVKHQHVHLAHQHKHSKLHEYYLWRKAYLEKTEQDRLTRRT
jgi:hypothetical protein